MSSYGFGRIVDLEWDQAIERVTLALKDEGFGVLTRMDVHDVLKAKIGLDMDPYVVLGACNPQLASRAIELDVEIGLLLPCNVLVRALSSGQTAISIADPKVMGVLAEDSRLKPLMLDAENRLRRALESVR